MRTLSRLDAVEALGTVGLFRLQVHGAAEDVRGRGRLGDHIHLGGAAIQRELPLGPRAGREVVRFLHLVGVAAQRLELEHAVTPVCHVSHVVDDGELRLRIKRIRAGKRLVQRGHAVDPGDGQAVRCVPSVEAAAARVGGYAKAL